MQQFSESDISRCISLHNYRSAGSAVARKKALFLRWVAMTRDRGFMGTKNLFGGIYLPLGGGGVRPTTLGIESGFQDNPLPLPTFP